MCNAFTSPRSSRSRGAVKGFGTRQVIRVVLTQCLLAERNQVALNPSAALLVPPAAAARAR